MHIRSEALDESTQYEPRGLRVGWGRLGDGPTTPQPLRGRGICLGSGGEEGGESGGEAAGAVEGVLSPFARARGLHRQWGTAPDSARQQPLATPAAASCERSATKRRPTPAARPPSVAPLSAIGASVLNDALGSVRRQVRYSSGGKGGGGKVAWGKKTPDSATTCSSEGLVEAMAEALQGALGGTIEEAAEGGGRETTALVSPVRGIHERLIV